MEEQQGYIDPGPSRPPDEEEDPRTSGVPKVTGNPFIDLVIAQARANEDAAGASGDQNGGYGGLSHDTNGEYGGGSDQSGGGGYGQYGGGSSSGWGQDEPPSQGSPWGSTNVGSSSTAPWETGVAFQSSGDAGWPSADAGYGTFHDAIGATRDWGSSNGSATPTATPTVTPTASLWGTPTASPTPDPYTEWGTATPTATPEATPIPGSPFGFGDAMSLLIGGGPGEAAGKTPKLDAQMAASTKFQKDQADRDEKHRLEAKKDAETAADKAEKARLAGDKAEADRLDRIARAKKETFDEANTLFEQGLKKDAATRAAAPTVTPTITPTTTPTQTMDARLAAARDTAAINAILHPTPPSATPKPEPTHDPMKDYKAAVDVIESANKLTADWPKDPDSNRHVGPDPGEGMRADGQAMLDKAKKALGLPTATPVPPPTATPTATPTPMSTSDQVLGTIGSAFASLRPPWAASTPTPTASAASPTPLSGTAADSARPALVGYTTAGQMTPTAGAPLAAPAVAPGPGVAAAPGTRDQYAREIPQPGTLPPSPGQIAGYPGVDEFATDVNSRRPDLLPAAQDIYSRNDVAPWTPADRAFSRGAQRFANIQDAAAGPVSVGSAGTGALPPAPVPVPTGAQRLATALDSANVGNPGVPGSSTAIAQFGPELRAAGYTKEQIASMCGPIAFAAASGGRVTVGEALDVSGQNGWTPGVGNVGGMGGKDNVERTMRALLLEPLAVTPEQAMLAAGAGRGVVVSTGKHIYYANGVDANGALLVGNTGLARIGGAASMTLDQIRTIDGGINGLWVTTSSRAPAPSARVPEGAPTPPAGEPTAAPVNTTSVMKYAPAVHKHFGDLGPEAEQNILNLMALESSGDPNALNTHRDYKKGTGEHSTGLLQVNTAPGANTDMAGLDLTNADTNLAAARQIYNRQGYAAWRTNAQTLGLPLGPGQGHTSTRAPGTPGYLPPAAEGTSMPGAGGPAGDAATTLPPATGTTTTTPGVKDNLPGAPAVTGRGRPMPTPTGLPDEDRKNYIAWRLEQDPTWKPPAEEEDKPTGPHRGDKPTNKEPSLGTAASTGGFSATRSPTGLYTTRTGLKTLAQIKTELAQAGWSGNAEDEQAVIEAYARTTGGSVVPGTAPIDPVKRTSAWMPNVTKAISGKNMPADVALALIHTVSQGDAAHAGGLTGAPASAFAPGAAQTDGDTSISAGVGLLSTLYQQTGDWGQAFLSYLAQLGIPAGEQANGALAEFNKARATYAAPAPPPIAAAA